MEGILEDLRELERQVNGRASKLNRRAGVRGGKTLGRGGERQYCRSIQHRNRDIQYMEGILEDLKERERQVNGRASKLI